MLSPQYYMISLPLGYEHQQERFHRGLSYPKPDDPPLSSPRPVLIGRMVRPMAPARRAPRRSTPRRQSARSDGYRRKARIVVGQDFVESACLLGFRVAVGVGAADEPRHGGRVPFRAERSEILAGWRQSGLAYSVVGKMPAERVGDAPQRILAKLDCCPVSPV